MFLTLKLEIVYMVAAYLLSTVVYTLGGFAWHVCSENCHKYPNDHHRHAKKIPLGYIPCNTKSQCCPDTTVHAGLDPGFQKWDIHNHTHFCACGVPLFLLPKYGNQTSSFTTVLKSIAATFS